MGVVISIVNANDSDHFLSLFSLSNPVFQYQTTQLTSLSYSLPISNCFSISSGDRANRIIQTTQPAATEEGCRLACHLLYTVLPCRRHIVLRLLLPGAKPPG